MSRKKTLLLGTFFLTLTGVVSRIAGFFYRIFLSRTIGAEQLGLYQLSTPVCSLALAFCSAGISTSLSRFVAARTAKKDSHGALNFLFAGLFLCLSFSLVVSLCFFSFAGPIARFFLHEERTVPLLRTAALSLPLAVTHSCICGWYYGRSKTAVPSVCQLLEQLVRIVSSVLFSLLLLRRHQTPGAMTAAIGALAGDIAASLFCLAALFSNRLLRHFRLALFRSGSAYFRPLLQMASPLMANRICMALLHSLETTLIPVCLVRYGMTSSEALRLYGILSGMTLPMIFFPSAVTNALSLLLLPEVAKDQAAGNDASISRSVTQTLRFCLLLGIFSLGMFYFLGPSLGNALFSNHESGAFLRVLAFLCPFLYLDSTFSSILTGLGKTRQVFWQNIAGLGVRILFVWFFLPVTGIRGYLYGLLCSELLTTFLRIRALRRETSFSFPVGSFLILPLLAMLVSNGCILFLRRFEALVSLPTLLVLLLELILSAVLYLLLLLPFLPLPAVHGFPRKQ